MKKDIYSEIIDSMKFRQAHIVPLKTRVIADNVKISIHQARYYLEELRKLNMVRRSATGQGKITLWTLVC